MKSLSGWDYRVVKQTFDGEDVFAVHEVYYEDDGKPHMMSEDEVSPHGESLKEFKSDWKAYLDAKEQPVLTYPDDFQNDKKISTKPLGDSN